MTRRCPLASLVLLPIALAACSHGTTGTGAGGTASPSPSPTPPPPSPVEANFTGTLEEGILTGQLAFLSAPESPTLTIEMTAGSPSGQWSWHWKGGPPQPTIARPEVVPLTIPRRSEWERQLGIADRAIEAMLHACSDDSTVVLELREGAGAGLMTSSESCLFGIDALGAVARKVKIDDRRPALAGFVLAPDGVAPLVRSVHTDNRQWYADLYWPDGSTFHPAYRVDPADGRLAAVRSASAGCTRPELFLDGGSLVDRRCAGKKAKDVAYRWDGKKFVR